MTVEEAGERRAVHATAGSGGSFGGSSLQQEIGLGRAERIVAIEIVWPGSGTRQVLRGPEKNRTYRVVEGADALQPVEAPRLTLASDGSARHH